MPRSFFDQVLVPPARRRSGPWVTAGSVLLHALALVALFVWPLLAAFEMPDVHTPLPPMVIASIAPPPPEVPVTPPAPVPSVNPDAAPVVAPDEIRPEVPRPEASSLPPIPGGLPTGAAGARFTGLLNDRSAGTGLSAPPPPPEPPAPRRVGGIIDAPVRTYYRPPVYPPIAQSARVEGLVVLEATIDATGLVTEVKVLRSVPLLDNAAIDAVRQWRYTPTRLNGQPIPVIMTVTVTFSLK